MITYRLPKTVRGHLARVGVGDGFCEKSEIGRCGSHVCDRWGGEKVKGGGGGQREETIVGLADDTRAADNATIPTGPRAS